LILNYSDGSNETRLFAISTKSFADSSGILISPVILRRRSGTDDLGFDYLAMKSRLGGPIIIDTDGEIRWVSSAISSSFVSNFIDGGFVVGNESSTDITRLELDGTRTTLSSNPSTGYVNFHHNLDLGRDELLGEVNTPSDIESTIVEVNAVTGMGKAWDLAKIIADHMVINGDDATAFVRPGVDWFHSNAAAYNESDDSLIVSSRENFLIDLDYITGSIKWILGDPTKYWYRFPSLRDKALLLANTGTYPIGQHSVSVTKDGRILIFNNGNPSLNQPVGAPVGTNRSYSTVSAYTIDPINKTATLVWEFDYGKSIYSAVCGSAYEASDGSVLVDYAYADNGTHSRLVGLNSNHQVVFDFQYDTAGCNTSWNAVPIPLQDLRF